jgi:hypothetical protein
MSSFNAVGFFALADGRRVATHTPGNNFPFHHCHYTTSLKSLDNTNVSATLRVYSGAGDAPLANNSVVFVVAKASSQAGKPVELDAIVFTPMPGDINDDHYEARLATSPLN